jgi:UDP-2-acetamido-2-deoxy-ribo-hexuluronate aminotransferase
MECEVETGIHYPIPVHRQAACEPYSRADGLLPATERAVHEILSLPIYPELREEEVEYICRCIAQFFEAKTGKTAPIAMVRS